MENNAVLRRQQNVAKLISDREVFKCANLDDNFQRMNLLFICSLFVTHYNTTFNLITLITVGMHCMFTRALVHTIVSDISV